MRISVQVEGGNSLRVGASGAINAAAIATASEVADMIANELRNFPFEYQGGQRDTSDRITFEEGVDVDIGGSGDRLEILVKSNAPHAVYLEEGTSEHSYGPTNAKVLVIDSSTLRGGFETSKKSGRLGNSGFLATKWVDHPGIQDPPQPFKTVANNLRPDIAGMFRNSVLSVLNDAGRFYAGKGVSLEITSTGKQRFRGAGGRFVVNPFI